MILNVGRRRRAPRRPPVLFPDEVVPAVLTDPSLQAVRDRRWAKKTAASSMAVLTVIGAFFLELFQPTRAQAVAEQQQTQSGADKALRVGDPEDGGGRFESTVDLR